MHGITAVSFILLFCCCCCLLPHASQQHKLHKSDFHHKVDEVISRVHKTDLGDNENDNKRKIKLGETGADFKCRLRRSLHTPTSAHELRPADIDVVAAMGDSVVAGFGILAKDLAQLQNFIDYRGYSFSIGGEGHLFEHVTVPNIITTGNRKLHGQSTGNGPSDCKNAGLNVARTGATSDTLLNQAKELVQRMKSDPFVDFEKGWKMITIFIGANDICNYCHNKSQYTASKYRSRLTETLDYLHENVPRAFVNAIELLDVSLVKNLHANNPGCQMILAGICRCPAFPENSLEEEEIKQLVMQYQTELSQLVDSGRYDTREDFTVVAQPFLRQSEPPRINGIYDMSYFSPDCFHFSAKGHAAAAMGLWNNMLEPVGKKTEKWEFNSKLTCPTEKQPFLRTNKNS